MTEVNVNVKVKSQNAAKKKLVHVVKTSAAVSKKLI